MNKKVNIGIIGCGTISNTYLKNLTEHFDNLTVIACADMFIEKAKETQESFNIPTSCTVDEILANPEVELIVNLTIPAAHYSINMQALKSGKHVYCEKPLALSLTDALELTNYASTHSLKIGSAPDTFLGAGIQTCISLIEEGCIGTPTGFTANMVSPGHELWHPAPEFYYKEGAGPMLDMGPYYLTALVAILGPISQLSCFSKTSRNERITRSRNISVEVPTHYAGIMKMQNGAIGNVNMSFDVWNSDLPLLEIYGTKGSIKVPDPNLFNGKVTLFDGEKMANIVEDVDGTPFDRIVKMHTCSDECSSEISHLFPSSEDERLNMRGMGVADMAQSIIDNRSSRISADVSCHIVEALCSFDIASKNKEVYTMTTTCERPDPMPTGLKLWEVK
ncbi:MAG: Gfo/Idh/MocA family protein [Suipraeoptans sp.]